MELVRMGLFSFICMHMVLWTACYSAPLFHKLESNVEAVTKETYPTDVIRASWRKLLIEASTDPDQSKEGTLNVSDAVITDWGNADEKPTGQGNSDNKEEVKEGDSTNETKESDSTNLSKEETLNVGAAVITDWGSADEKSDGKVYSNSEEEVKKSNAVDVNEEEMKVNVTVSAKDDAEKSEKPENNAVQEATNGQEFGEERKDVLPEQSDAHTSETKNKNVPTIDDKDGNENNIVSVNKKPDEPASQVNVNLVQTTDVRNVSMQGKDAIGNVTENSEQEGFIIELGETEKKEDGKEKSEDTIQTLSLQDPERKEEKGGNITEAEPEVRHDGEEGKQEEIVEEEIQESRNASGHEQGNQDGVDMNEEKKENDGEADGDRKEEVIKVQHDREGESLKNSTESNGENIEESREEEALQVQSNDTKEMKPEEHVEESSNDSGNEGEATGANRNEESKEQNHEPIVDDMDEGKESALRDDSIFQTKDNEAETATKEVEMQLEALKRDSEMETTVQQAHERDPSDDDYDIIQELTDLPTKLQETAGKVAEHLRPDVIKWKDTSKVYFDLANQQIRDSFSPLVGRQYAPFFASMISYGILLLPLIIVIMLFDHIKALFSLQKVLLFVNIYLAAYFATLWLASFIIGLEPMSFFYFNSLSSYISLQLLQALGYLIYLILQTTNVVYSCTSDTLAGKVNSSLQWVVAMVIGLHYYVTVFHPAVTSKPPHTSWKFYAMYTVAFFFLCLFARIRWVKKPYVTSGNSISDKKS